MVCLTSSVFILLSCDIGIENRTDAKRKSSAFVLFSSARKVLIDS